MQSAEQRAKAEAERTKWEAVRAQEEKEGREWESRVLGDRRDTLKFAPSAVGLAALGESSGSVSGWESVAAESRGGRLSPGPANQVGGEAQGRTHAVCHGFACWCPRGSGVTSLDIGRRRAEQRA